MNRELHSEFLCFSTKYFLLPVPAGISETKRRTSNVIFCCDDVQIEPSSLHRLERSVASIRKLGIASTRVRLTCTQHAPCSQRLLGAILHSSRFTN